MITLERGARYKCKVYIANDFRLLSHGLCYPLRSTESVLQTLPVL